MIGIRVDANDEIAMGHMMRCFSISHYLKDIIVITSDKWASDFIQSYGYQHLCMHNSIHSKEGELPKLISLITPFHIDKLIVDSYDVTPYYLSELRKYTKVIYIDDYIERNYEADLLVNYTFGVSEDDYLNRKKQCKLLLGSKYVPIRQEFRNVHRQKNKDIRKIFITTGGTDSFGMVKGLIEQFQTMNIELYVVVGKFYQGLEQIQNRWENVHVFYNIPNIWDVMKNCDLAISAGGTTLLELCALQLPIVCFSIAENQIPGTKAYSDHGVMVYAGDISLGKEKLLQNIFSQVSYLMSHPSIADEMAKKAHAMVDGRGAERIAREIENL